MVWSACHSHDTGVKGAKREPLGDAHEATDRIARLSTRSHQLATLTAIVTELLVHSSSSYVGERRSEMAKAKSPVPEGFHTVTPQLTLDNAAQSIEWYKKALGAEERSRFAGPDGKI